VRVRAIVIKSTGPQRQRPRKVKLFVNRPTIGFDDAAAAKEPEAAQVLELTDEQVVQARPVQLRFVRFQNVNHLSVRTRVIAWVPDGTRSVLTGRGDRYLWRRTQGMS
jgi:hypothetical protein